MSNGGDLDAPHQLVLQAVWDLFQLRHRWPVFDELDRHLHRHHRLLEDVADLLRSMPPGLLYGLDARSGARPADDHPIGLTVAGAARCDGSHDDLQAFVATIQYAVFLDREYEPPQPGAKPVLATRDLARALSLSLVGRTERLTRLGVLLESENWGSIGSTPRWDGWEFTLGRDVRKFAAITDVADFLAVQRRHFAATVPPPPPAPATTTSRGTRVFLVHGHDRRTRDDVAEAIRQLTGQKPVILDEEASRGLTVVEKFEQYAEESRFAVVILTPDDVGGPHGGTQRSRARQNVLFELGYFYGKVGRQNVAVLVSDDIELPSDVAGLGYVPLSDTTWRERLAREMAAAGMAISTAVSVRSRTRGPASPPTAWADAMDSVTAVHPDLVRSGALPADSKKMTDWRTPEGVVFAYDRESGHVWALDSGPVRELLSTIDGRPYLASNLWSKVSRTGTRQYGRHSGIQRIPELSEADLIRFEPRTSGDILTIIEHLRRS